MENVFVPCTIDETTKGLLRISLNSFQLFENYFDRIRHFAVLDSPQK